jgi:hypothetical protein
MIASELAGRKLKATEILAIEGGQSPYSPPDAFRQAVAARFSLAWLPASSAGRWTLLLGFLAIGRLAQEYVARRQRRR